MKLNFNLNFFAFVLEHVDELVEWNLDEVLVVLSTHVTFLLPASVMSND